MRKNLFIATLLGLSIVGLSACSRGDDNNTTDNTPSTAMTTPDAATDQNQAAPAQSADNTAVAPIPDNSTQIADSSAATNATPDAQTTSPAMSPDTNASMNATDMQNNGDSSMTTPPTTDSTMGSSAAPVSTDTTPQQ